MATTNPRVAAYLLPKNFERLKAFSKGRGLSVSQAVDKILSEYFGGELFSNTPQTEARLVALEASLGRVDTLSQEMVAIQEAIASLLADVTRLNSVLASDTSIASVPQSSQSELLSSTVFSSTVPFVPELSSVGELSSNTSIAPGLLTQASQSELLSSTENSHSTLEETGGSLSSPLSSTSKSASPEPLLEKGTLQTGLTNVFISSTPSDTLEDSAEAMEAESVEIFQNEPTFSESLSSLLEREQLYQQAIKRAKELKKKRLTQAQIADTLNAEGFTTITGRGWTRAAISRLFGS